MARFFTTVGGLVVGGPFVTYCQAQGFGVRYAREHGIQQHHMSVTKIGN